MSRLINQFDHPQTCPASHTHLPISPTYKGYDKHGSTAFKVQKDGCGVPRAARALLGPEGLLIR